MNRDTVDWCVYWLGIGFIVGCLYAAMSSCSTAHAGRRGHCPGQPPACDYGTVPVCWCPSGTDKCDWFCVSDGRVANQSYVRK